MEGLLLGLGQGFCLAVAHAFGPAGQCYQTAVMQSMGYAVLSGMTLTAGVIWLVARRRFGA